MRAVKALGLIVLFAAAIAFGAGVAYRTTTPAFEPAPPVADATLPAASVEVPHVASSAGPVAAAPAANAWGKSGTVAVDEMRADFVGSPDLVGLFEAGLRNPSAGGLFYARLAFRQCVALGRGTTAETPTHGTNALATARARCGSLGDSVSRDRLDATLQTATGRLDPALSILNELDERSKASRLAPGDVVRAIDASIAIGDPYVLRNVMLRGVPRLESFDGQPIGADLRGDLMMATRLAMCDLGIDCPREARALLTCARPDGCTNALVAMGIGDASMSDERRVALNELATRIGSAARDGSLATLFR